ncbi:NUDIX hydrolase [Frankia sp. AgB32]|uniref:NUDIX hydrolase n=1 Tax=Frankia sp. AgB32 TaxID=631119 RepID=UPI00200D0D00|nr:NUDIX hydrolase [Frankia sp. AgB32]MCK9894606.1 NUDIX hydrolase [Frankia sp. AgB32]
MIRQACVADTVGVLAEDDEGNQLLAFERDVREDALAVRASAAAVASPGDVASPWKVPLPAALVALWHGDELLLVFDRYRHRWELPGGGIDSGETPRETAVRELREESGYEVTDLLLAGRARFALQAGQRVEDAAIFAGRAEPTGAFTPNPEIAAITWWDGVRPIDGRVQVLDLMLGRLARAALR